ncbi:helix-turn-helix domain-containing protein [Pseudomonas beijingensis]|uniref:helix-turn-helix domain-containing protein n=1 Tax=Pseudomonas beijingensis TaxID=2954101 RepID=UPI0027375F61|nr:helix-turn-helix domain-containing protein [Pseudomonas sp. FP2262]WLH44230.1 helix-turn-helix domain-containing protein [Pseudomonas sp. FP2262]
MTETFCKLTHEIMRATHWVSKTTGQHFKLTGTQKIVWVHMTSRYEFFRSLGKEWFDDQEDIAKDTGCDVSTVKGFIKSLVDHGYILVDRKKLRGYVHSNSYKIVAPLQLYNKHASTVAPEQAVGVVKDALVASGALVSGESIATSCEVVGQLEPVFEDVPLEAYIDEPTKATVIVHETLQGFADTLDAEINYDVPVLPAGVGLGSSDSDLW